MKTHTKECPICKKNFISRPDRGTYCSQSCSGKARWINNKKSRSLKTYGVTKKCSRCALEKPISCFSKRTKHLLQSMCVSCRSVTRKKNKSEWKPRHVYSHTCLQCTRCFTSKSALSKYCCNRCQLLASDGIKSFRTNGHLPINTTRVTPDGYVIIKISMSKDPHEDWVKEHTYIMEQHINRKLYPHEIIHHIDGNKKNNAIENLKVMTQSDHMMIHHPRSSRCCMIDNCKNKHRARNLCSTHWKQWRKGDANITTYISSKLAH